MAKARIAVLFDAENINCDTATSALGLLAGRGTVQIKRAVGDFSAATLAGWIDCGREHGIELVLQPSLGKGKNGADIRLTIEAMDILHQGHVDTIALVTRDRDFTPLALRLREAGLTVLGFAQSAPNAAFVAACTSFEVLGDPVVAPSTATSSDPAPVALPAVPGPTMKTPATTASAIALDAMQSARLRQIVVDVSKQGPVTPAQLTRAVVEAAPDLATRLSGQNKFLKTLVAYGIVERVGKGADLTVRAARPKRVG